MTDSAKQAATKAAETPTKVVALETTMLRRGTDGEFVHIFAGDEIPEWAKESITNPAITGEKISGKLF